MCCVCWLVQVTHNSAFSTFIKEELFPAWHVEYVTTWYWLKVTDHGEMVGLHSDCAACVGWVEGQRADGMLAVWVCV